MEEMMRKPVVVTGSRGFLGRNLCARLLERGGVELLPYDLGDSEQRLRAALRRAEMVFHLAGVNRPDDPRDYETGNVAMTRQLCQWLTERDRPAKVVFASSIQAGLDNPYGRSKRAAEECLASFAERTGATVWVDRLTNVFGKWSRPHYNSVVATFCHQIARDLPIQVSDVNQEVTLVYVDDVTACWVRRLESAMAPGYHHDADTLPTTTVSLGQLAGRIQAYHEMRRTLRLPDFSDRFNRQLYATYLSFMDRNDLDYALQTRQDPRGMLAELMKSDAAGQVFVSWTRPGAVRGHHYHHTKTEKFVVLAGEAVIRLRSIDEPEVQEILVQGHQARVVDIPPGVTHCIENVGSGELVTLFWASEPFDPDQPDTYYLSVEPKCVTAGEREDRP